MKLIRCSITKKPNEKNRQLRYLKYALRLNILGSYANHVRTVWKTIAH